MVNDKWLMKNDTQKFNPFLNHINYQNHIKIKVQTKKKRKRNSS
jgi:hypothetical protein